MTQQLITYKGGRQRTHIRRRKQTLRNNFVQKTIILRGTFVCLFMQKQNYMFSPLSQSHCPGHQFSNFSPINRKT